MRNFSIVFSVSMGAKIRKEFETAKEREEKHRITLGALSKKQYLCSRILIPSYL